jgi:hypothetical protein
MTTLEIAFGAPKSITIDSLSTPPRLAHRVSKSPSNGAMGSAGGAHSGVSSKEDGVETLTGR